MPNEVNDPSTTYVEDAAETENIDTAFDETAEDDVPSDEITVIEDTDITLEELPEDEISIEEIAVDEDMPLTEEEEWAYKILKRAATLKGITIQRDVFLRTELSKKCPPEVVDAAINSSPLEAGISTDIIDGLADAAITLETNKVTALSAIAGIPGGLFLVGTIPADLVQYFGHTLRIEQKLAYLYGWQSFLNEEDEVDDETMCQLILFLGIMMGVGSINLSVIKFASETAKVGIAKTIQKQALTKTVWYTPLKKILSVVGVKVTKSSFAEVVSRGVPLVGGAVSGGLTYITFRPSAVKLKEYLRILPQATGVNRPEEEIQAEFEQIDKEANANIKKALDAAGDMAGNIASVAVDTAGNIVGAAGDIAGDIANAAGGAAGGIANAAGDVAGNIANAAGDMAGNIANAAGGAASGIASMAAGIGESSKGFFSRFAPKKKTKSPEPAPETATEQVPEPTPESAPKPTDAAAIAEQLRLYKGLLDDGIITQEDFDAKKRELLGL